MKIRNMMRKFFQKSYIRTACIASVLIVALALPTFAAEADMSSMTTVLTTAFQGMITEMLAAITAILPITLTLVGCSIVIAFGIKWFKKIIGHA